MTFAQQSLFEKLTQKNDSENFRYRFFVCDFRVLNPSSRIYVFAFSLLFYNKNFTFMNLQFLFILSAFA